MEHSSIQKKRRGLKPTAQKFAIPLTQVDFTPCINTKPEGTKQYVTMYLLGLI